ncbi:MAG: hypothetical protein ACPL3Q_07745, partial [Candidatus Ratteibacteria bacterium]
SRYEKFLEKFTIAASAIKKEWPQAKCLLPWGIPSFPIPFLRYSKEATELMDGPALDVVLFERIHEMQMHQVTFASVMWQLKQEWLKTGKKWISNGKNGEWNVDDVHCASMFCFDGWRYLRFELPGNHPYDCFREPGTCWWGSYGGDGIVDLPLSIEKIFIERRTHVIVGDKLVPADTSDVLFADLYAEYECDENNTAQAIRLSKLRMPVTNNIPEIDNPTIEFQKTGIFPPTEITSITVPEQKFDGTKCYVWFKKMENADTYEIWVSPYENGAGAICLGEKWTEPGGLLSGLNPNTDLYIFVVYRDKTGKPSKPSKAFHIRLKDMFPMK